MTSLPRGRPRSDARRLLGFLEARRVLVLGASGWLGRSLTNALNAATVGQVLMTSSDGRDISIGGARRRTTIFDVEMIESYRPEVVVNAAFLTKSRLGEFGPAEFMRINRRLSAQFLMCAELPSVRMAVTVSSGAARLAPEDPDQNLYGDLKLDEENAVRDLVSRGVNCGIARAWSLSGPHVVRPRDYAFSDFILQAIEGGRILVRARGEVWRRYTDATRFLMASIAGLERLGVQELDSGGELVEVRELAQLVAELHGAEVTSSEPTHDVDSYASDGQQYEAICAGLGMRPESLSGQVHTVSKSMRRAMGPLA